MRGYAPSKPGDCESGSRALAFDGDEPASESAKKARVRARSETAIALAASQPESRNVEPVGLITEASCSGASRVSREGEAAMADYHEGTLSSLPARIVPTCCGWGRLSL